MKFLLSSKIDHFRERVFAFHADAFASGGEHSWRSHQSIPGAHTANQLQRLSICDEYMTAPLLTCRDRSDLLVGTGASRLFLDFIDVLFSFINQLKHRCPACRRLQQFP
jgi:hypothetical protein